MDTVITGDSIARLLRRSHSRRVTRGHPRIDRSACSWLIRRYIDARAKLHNAYLFKEKS